MQRIAIENWDILTKTHSSCLESKPSQYFSVAAGNNFYKRFSIPSAYLAAADDTTKYGRLLTDSLGHEEYFGTDSFSVFSNGFALGATSEWNWGDYNQFNLILAAGSTM